MMLTEALLDVNDANIAKSQNDICGLRKLRASCLEGLKKAGKIFLPIKLYAKYAQARIDKDLSKLSKTRYEAGRQDILFVYICTTLAIVRLTKSEGTYLEEMQKRLANMPIRHYGRARAGVALRSFSNEA